VITPRLRPVLPEAVCLVSFIIDFNKWIVDNPLLITQTLLTAAGSLAVGEWSGITTSVLQFNCADCAAFLAIAVEMLVGPQLSLRHDRHLTYCSENASYHTDT
jgi:hypothetical protein